MITERLLVQRQTQSNVNTCTYSGVSELALNPNPNPSGMNQGVPLLVPGASSSFLIPHLSNL